ncbi:kinase-like domain-containing protein [Entophlyctis helioformis]|nr:kinase-like domain-containing protein [Entophlyctis helioformis]
MRHPNIAQLYEVLCTESRIYMVMEFCNGGEAFDYIVKHGRLDDQLPECRRIFGQIMDAVAQCHEKNFVHRDLKLENILLTDDLHVKLIDFGFTRDYENTKLLDTYCGSSAYASPEIVSGRRYSGPEADIWSLGVILYTLLCGYLPFDEDNDAMTHKKITELDYEFPEFLSDVSKDFVSRFLKINPSERITIADAFRHPWYTDYREMLLAAKLEAIGFDVQSILASVHSNACDQASALWYLLLRRERELAAANAVSEAGAMSMDVASPISPMEERSSVTSSISASSQISAMSGVSAGSAGTSGMVTSISIAGGGGDDVAMMSAGQAIARSASGYFTQAWQKSVSPSDHPLLNFASNATSLSPLSASTPSLVPGSGSGGSSGSLSSSAGAGLFHGSLSTSHPVNGFGSASTSMGSMLPPSVATGGRGRRGYLMESMRAAPGSSATTTSPHGESPGPVALGCWAAQARRAAVAGSPVGNPTPARLMMAGSSARGPAGIAEESEPEESPLEAV